MLFSHTKNQQAKQNLKHSEYSYISMIEKAESQRRKDLLPLIFTETCMEPGTWVCALDFDAKNDGDREVFNIVEWACQQVGIAHARTPQGISSYSSN